MIRHIVFAVLFGLVVEKLTGSFLLGLVATLISAVLIELWYDKRVGRR